MRKTFSLLILILFSILNCSKSTDVSLKENDVSANRLNGKVKSVQSQLYNLIAEKDTFRIGEKINGMSSDRNSFMEFDQFGILISSKEFLANGKVSDEIIYTYDKDDRLIKRKEIDNYGKGSFYDFEFKYNSQDSVTQFIISNDDFRRVHKIERDEKNRVKKSEIVQNDTIFATYIVKYDQNDNVIVENEFRNKNTPIKLIDRTFNKLNLKETEQVVEYKTWDTLNYSNRFVYDTNQNLIIEKYNIEADSIYTEIKNVYYKNGKLKESVSIRKGSRYSAIMIKKYDEYENLIENSRTSYDGITNDIWTYKYKYDSNKNWIEKLEFKNDYPLRVLKRTIQYYE